MDVSTCTPGPWIAQERYDDTVVLAPDERPIAVLWFDENGSEEDNSRMFDDAQLIAEAGTVAHETGLSPRQLAQQRSQLLACLREVRCAITELNAAKKETVFNPAVTSLVDEAILNA